MEGCDAHWESCCLTADAETLFPEGIWVVLTFSVYMQKKSGFQSGSTSKLPISLGILGKSLGCPGMKIECHASYFYEPINPLKFHAFVVVVVF